MQLKTGDVVRIANHQYSFSYDQIGTIIEVDDDEIYICIHNAYDKDDSFLAHVDLSCVVEMIHEY